MGGKTEKAAKREGSPRFKKKKRDTQSGVSVIIMDLPDLSRLSAEIPDCVKIGIANAVMAFSEMEASAENVIWQLAGLSMDDGKILTQRDSKEKLDLAKKLSERYGIPIHAHPKTTSDIWSVVRQIVEGRNKIAHGIWRMIDEKTPLAISYRIPTTPGHVTGEVFSLERLHLIADNCQKIKVLFNDMIEHISSLPTRPTALPHERSPILLEYPLPSDR